MTEAEVVSELQQMQNHIVLSKDRSEMTALEREIADTPGPIIVKLSDIKPEMVRWIWPGRLARGKLSLLIGDPGHGKSMATIDIACRISRGNVWPDKGRAEIGNILMLVAEDGLADTVRPRVDLHGGDPSRINIIKGIKCGDIEQPFSLANDLPHLETAIKLVDNIKVIIIDPLSAYLGNKDSYKDTEVRAILTPLGALAEKHGVAVMAIIHLGKSEQRKAIYRALGSVGFIAAARTVFAVGIDPDNPDRKLVVCIKNNISAKPDALAYTILEQDGQGLLQWEKDPIAGVDADSILSGSNSEEREERLSADEFLTQLLADGPVSANDVFQAARQNGFSEPTVKRAKARLGIKAEHVGQPGEKGKWFWLPPKGITQASKGINLDNVIPFGQLEDTKAITSITSSKGITDMNMIPFGDPLRGKDEDQERL